MTQQENKVYMFLSLDKLTEKKYSLLKKFTAKFINLVLCVTSFRFAYML